jgi:hypothetical protein
MFAAGLPRTIAMSACLPVSQCDSLPQETLRRSESQFELLPLFPTQRRKGAKETFRNAAALCAFAWESFVRSLVFVQSGSNGLPSNLSI